MPTETPFTLPGFDTLLGVTYREVGPDRVVATYRRSVRNCISRTGSSTAACTARSSRGRRASAPRPGSASAAGSSAWRTRPTSCAPSRTGELTATATPLHRGRLQQLWQVVVIDAAGPHRRARPGAAAEPAESRRTASRVRSRRPSTPELTSPRRKARAMSDARFTTPDGDTLDLPITEASEGSSGAEHRQAALVDRPGHLRLRLREHRLVRVGDHLHRRRRRHPALPRLPDRPARREVVVPRGQLPAHLRRAADRRRARRVRGPDPSAHAAARGPQALLRRLPARRAPDAGAVVGGVGAVDLLPGRARPVRRGRRAAVDRPAAREAAHDRRVRLQEVGRRSRSCTRTTRSAWSRTSCG